LFRYYVHVHFAWKGGPQNDLYRTSNPTHSFTLAKSHEKLTVLKYNEPPVS